MLGILLDQDMWTAKKNKGKSGVLPSGRHDTGCVSSSFQQFGCMLLQCPRLFFFVTPNALKARAGISVDAPWIVDVFSASFLVEICIPFVQCNDDLSSIPSWIFRALLILWVEVCSSRITNCLWIFILFWWFLSYVFLFQPVQLDSRRF